MKSHPFEQTISTTPSTKYSDSKWCAKNVQALEDGRDFDPNELEELITLVEDIMG